MGFGWAELESLGSLLGGIGTTATLAATLWLIKRDSDDRRRRADNEEIRTARLVSAGLGTGEPANHLGPEKYEAVFVDVVNHSSEPISEARVFVPGLGRPLWIGDVGPGATRGNGRYDAPEGWHLQYVGPGCPGTPSGLDLEVVFRDNRGLRWRRNGFAEPVRLAPTVDVEQDWLARVKDGRIKSSLIGDPIEAMGWDDEVPATR